MRTRFPPLSSVIHLLIVVGCGGSNASSGSGELGGSLATGGTDPAGNAFGGNSAAGGTTNSGGVPSAGSTATFGLTGGVPAAGGASVGGSNSGGRTSSSSGSTFGGPKAAGGSKTTGGSNSMASGGMIATGGNAVATGGAATSGSSKPAGGSLAVGGTTSSGGSKSSGGSNLAGGSNASGGASSGGASSTSGAVIRNDVFWKDTAGNPIYSQGGGVLKVGSTYYWYGVKYNGAVTYAANPKSSNSDTGFVAVTIYSSTDLATWKFEGNALTAASLSTAGADPNTWIGRVGAAYNATTKKYVLNGQYQGTPDTTQFFATSDTPNGAFEWERTQATITNVTNNNCGDQSIFNDDDGKAYLVCSSQSGRSNLYVAPLRPADYLNVEPATRVFGGAGREGNAMFKYNGRYYLCSSDLHGWNASHSYYISATNIMGPYGTEGIIGNTDADFSHVTQTGLFITVTGTHQSTVIFGGDRWSDFAGNGIGYNQWMPLTFDGATPIMQSSSEWTIDVSSGTWRVGPGNNYVLNPSFEADRVEVTQPAGWTTANGSNVTSSHTGHWSWQLSGTASLDQAIANLPNGTYTLSAWVKSSTAGAQLYAKGFGGADQTSAISASSSWTNLSLTGITVTNGKCNVGVTSSGQTVSVDDFVLVKG